MDLTRIVCSSRFALFLVLSVFCLPVSHATAQRYRIVEDSSGFLFSPSPESFGYEDCFADRTACRFGLSGEFTLATDPNNGNLSFSDVAVHLQNNDQFLLKHPHFPGANGEAITQLPLFSQQSSAHPDLQFKLSILQEPTEVPPVTVPLLPPSRLLRNSTLVIEDPPPIEHKILFESFFATHSQPRSGFGYLGAFLRIEEEGVLAFRGDYNANQVDGLGELIYFSAIAVPEPGSLVLCVFTVFLPFRNTASGRGTAGK